MHHPSTGRLTGMTPLIIKHRVISEAVPIVVCFFASRGARRGAVFKDRNQEECRLRAENMNAHRWDLHAYQFDGYDTQVNFRRSRNVRNKFGTRRESLSVAGELEDSRGPLIILSNVSGQNCLFQGRTIGWKTATLPHRCPDSGGSTTRSIWIIK